MNDATTAFLAFATVALGLGFYMWHLESRARRLEDRLARLTRRERDDHVPPDHVTPDPVPPGDSMHHGGAR